MNERFHPFTLGEILDRTAQMYRARFLQFLGIAAIPTVVLLAFVAATAGFFVWAIGEPSRGFSGNALGVLIFAVLGVLVLVGLPVCTGAMALSWAALMDAASGMLRGEMFTIRGSYGGAWKRRWRYSGLLTMEALFVGVIPASAAFGLSMLNSLLTTLADKAGLGALGILSGAVTLALFAALAGGSLWILLRVCMAFAVCVVEERSAWQALKRSAALSAGTKGRLFLLFLLGWALGWLLVMGFYVPVGIALAMIPGAGSPQHAQMLGMVLMFLFYGMWFVAQALTRPVYGIALTLFYFDQRIRREGFDIEWLMQEAGMVTEGLPAAEAVPWLTLAGAAPKAVASVEQVREKAAKPTVEPPVPGVSQS